MQEIKILVSRSQPKIREFRNACHQIRKIDKNAFFVAFVDGYFIFKVKI